jgi:ethanolamine kinase
VDCAALQREVDEVRAACEALRSPLVFSHNDLLSGNILVLQPKGFTRPSDDGPLQFIDFEYGAPPALRQGCRAAACC